MYQEDLESQLKIAKRSSLKAEEAMTQQEIEKRRQDYMIDNLTDQLRMLQERRSAYKTQIENQQRETRALLDMVQEATTETEVNFSYLRLHSVTQMSYRLFNLKRISYFNNGKLHC